MRLPAAVHSLCQIEVSPSKVMPSRLAANSLSRSEALTLSWPFSDQRRAVSLTTAKASGKMTNNSSSMRSSMRFTS